MKKDPHFRIPLQVFSNAGPPTVIVGEYRVYGPKLLGNEIAHVDLTIDYDCLMDAVKTYRDEHAKREKGKQTS
jgi:hypothetical protein